MPVMIAGIGTAVPPHRDRPGPRRPRSPGNTLAKRRTTSAYLTLSTGGLASKRRHSVVLEPSNGDRGPRQSFYGDASPTTRDRMLAYEEQAGDLAVAAARNALADAQVAPEP